MITTKKSSFATTIDTKRARTVFEELLDWSEQAETQKRAIEIAQATLDRSRKETEAGMQELYECLNHLKKGDSLNIVARGDLYTLKVNHEAGRVEILVQDIDIDCDNT